MIRQFILVVAITVPLPVAAATVRTFDVAVTQSFDRDDVAPGMQFFDLPDLGTLGTITISTVADSVLDMTMIPFDQDAPEAFGLIDASVAFPTLSSSLEGLGSIRALSDGTVFLTIGSFSGISVDFPRDADAGSTYAGLFSLFSPSMTTPPATLGDFVALLADPQAQAGFRFNGTTFGGIDTSFAAGSADVPAIPLPATAPLLVGALGLIGLARKRRSAG